MNRIYAQGEKAPAIRLLRACKRLRDRPLIAFPLVAAFSAAALTARFELHFYFDGAPFLVLYPTVIVACFVAGTWAGFFVAGIGGALQWILFIPEARPLAMITYTIDAAICVMLIDFLNHSFDLLLSLLEYEKKCGRTHYLVGRELHHRIQNLFQVIQAVIRLSMPGHNEKCRALRDRLLDRFQAMSATNQMISDSHQNGVSLCKLVGVEIDAIPDSHRVHVTCPDGVVVGPQLAQNLSLIMHELITNAMKHGSLSVAEGRVLFNMQWDRTKLYLRWREFDGPRVRVQQGEAGFGSRLLDQFARRMGSVRINYYPTGLVYSLVIDATDIWIGDADLTKQAA